jgi:hypothetical protein
MWGLWVRCAGTQLTKHHVCFISCFNSSLWMAYSLLIRRISSSRYRCLRWKWVSRYSSKRTLKLNFWFRTEGKHVWYEISCMWELLRRFIFKVNPRENSSMNFLWRRTIIYLKTSWCVILCCYLQMYGARGSVVVKALCYKPEGRGFDTRWGEFSNLPNHSGRTKPWGLLSL